MQNSTPQPPIFQIQIQIQISVKQWAIIEEIDELNMASQLPNFTLELHGDMKANWEYFYETFESYVTLMGYRPKYTAKEMAALKCALPKEARAVLKNSIKWEQGEDQQDPALTLKKLGKYYAGTKNIIHERVVFIG